MYGLKHHVEGEEGLPGNPESTNSVRLIGRVLLALALLAGCAGLSGFSRPRSAILDILSIALLVSGVLTLVYESEIRDRMGHWGR